jgi:hypothetical protein
VRARHESHKNSIVPELHLVSVSSFLGQVVMVMVMVMVMMMVTDGRQMATRSLMMLIIGIIATIDGDTHDK